MKIIRYLIIFFLSGAVVQSLVMVKLRLLTDDGPMTVTNPLLDFTVPSNFPDATYSIIQNPPTEKGFELGKKIIL